MPFSFAYCVAGPSPPSPLRTVHAYIFSREYSAFSSLVDSRPIVLPTLLGVLSSNIVNQLQAPTVGTKVGTICLLPITRTVYEASSLVL